MRRHAAAFDKLLVGENVSFDSVAAILQQVISEEAS
jgi:hypothetical protein